MNCVQLIGRAGRDPEAKHFQNGKFMVKCSMAVERRGGGSTDQEGEQPTADWFEVQAWGKTAELLERYIHKGDRFGVNGSLRQEKWQDQQGQNRERIVVVADRLTFLESKKDAAAVGTNRTEPIRAAAGAGRSGRNDDLIVNEDDVAW